MPYANEDGVTQAPIQGPLVTQVIERDMRPDNFDGRDDPHGSRVDKNKDQDKDQDQDKPSVVGLGSASLPSLEVLRKRASSSRALYTPAPGVIDWQPIPCMFGSKRAVRWTSL